MSDSRAPSLKVRLLPMWAPLLHIFSHFSSTICCFTSIVNATVLIWTWMIIITSNAIGCFRRCDSSNKWFALKCPPTQQEHIKTVCTHWGSSNHSTFVPSITAFSDLFQWGNVFTGGANEAWTSALWNRLLAVGSEMRDSLVHWILISIWESGGSPTSPCDKKDNYVSQLEMWNNLIISIMSPLLWLVYMLKLLLVFASYELKHILTSVSKSN